MSVLLLLGGNKKGKIRTYINLFLVMLIGGLWHGAAVRFIIWGALHGFGLMMHKLWMKWFPSKENPNLWSRFWPAFITFHFVIFAWIFFRADSMRSVSTILSQIFYHFNWQMIPDVIVSYKNVFSLILLGFIIHWLPVSTKEYYKNYFMNPVTVNNIQLVEYENTNRRPEHRRWRTVFYYCRSRR